MSKLATFFDQYRIALTNGDIKAIASAYGDHFLVSGPGGQQYMKNGRSFRSMLKLSTKFYQKADVRSVRVARFDASVLDKHHAGVQIEWQLIDGNGKELIRHDVSYIVFVDRKGMHIIFFVSHNEEDRWQDKGYM